MRSSYWANSRFIKYVRSKFGLTNPSALSAEDWEKWREESESKNLFVHWLTDDFISSLQSFLCKPFDIAYDIRCAIKNRFNSKCHTLQTGLNPWEYHEVDTRILHGLFETLVDFVEIEKAWMGYICGEEDSEYKWYEKNAYCSTFIEKRHPNAGLRYLQWEMSLKKDETWFWDRVDEAKASGEFNQPTPQAIAAKEQFDLYHWWKNVRPNRPDPQDASGYSAIYDKWIEDKVKTKKTSLFGLPKLPKTEEEKELSRLMRESSARMSEIEAEYAREDEEMMIRLIKIRSSLWT